MFHLLLAVIYLSFISLGLPDSLLGSAWPKMYVEFGVPVSYAGVISMIISFNTIISSLQSDRLTRKLGTGKVTAISVGITAVSLFGFSISNSFWMLCLWAIPYGLGAGSVDASLNNYVALHYASRHMSWLHCMWGVGAATGPYIMGYALSNGQGWNMGYRYISIMQIVLTAILFLSLPLWKNKNNAVAASNSESTGNKSPKNTTASQSNSNYHEQASSALKNNSAKNGNAAKNNAETASANNGASEKTSTEKPLTLREIFAIPGAKEIMLTFFCYCALESTAMLWASSYLTLHVGLSAERAASMASLFFLGITAGRAASGFLTLRFNDTQMIRLGQAIVAVGIFLLLLPFGENTSLAGLIFVGLGCAPIYPSIIHSTPAHFGADKSQAVIGVQMASAYVGSCLMPPIFGLIANHITVALLPIYLLAALVLMVFMHEKLNHKTA